MDALFRLSYEILTYPPCDSEPQTVCATPHRISPALRILDASYRDSIHSSRLFVNHSHKITTPRSGQGTQPEMHLSNDVNWSGLCCYSHA